MKDHIQTLMKLLDFPADAQSFYIDFFEKLTPSDIDFFKAMQSEYFMEHSDNEAAVNDYVYKTLGEYACEKGFEPHGFYMLFLLYCSKKLKKYYKEKGYGEEMYINLMKDLYVKNNECKRIHKVWGTMTFLWFHRHFLGRLFALGRFQFEKIKLWEPYEKAGVALTANDTVYNIHIPALGPLNKEIRFDSYKKAFRFFGFKKGDKMPIVCESWLLYPENKNIYDVNSNLYAFMNDFDIISGGEYETAFKDAWRVFGMDFDGDTKKLPQNTSLQKNIAKWLSNGKTIGYGHGIIIFDGEKIINK